MTVRAMGAISTAHKQGTLALLRCTEQVGQPVATHTLMSSWLWFIGTQEMRDYIVLIFLTRKLQQVLNTFWAPYTSDPQYVAQPLSDRPDGKEGEGQDCLSQVKPSDAIQNLYKPINKPLGLQTRAQGKAKISKHPQRHVNQVPPLLSQNCDAASHFRVVHLNTFDAGSFHFLHMYFFLFYIGAGSAVTCNIWRMRYACHCQCVVVVPVKF